MEDAAAEDKGAPDVDARLVEDDVVVLVGVVAAVVVISTHAIMPTVT